MHIRKKDVFSELHTHTKPLIKIGKWLYWIPLTQEFVSDRGRFTLLWYNFYGSGCLRLWGSLGSSHIPVFAGPYLISASSRPGCHRAL